MDLTLPFHSLFASPGWPQAILLGSWFGLLHAFDADHVATLGGLAVGNRSLTPIGYALRWALGHAAALGLIALAVLGLGATGIVEWSSYAELCVCLALFLIGANALRTLRQRARAASAAMSTVTHARDSARPHLHFLAPFHAHARAGRAGVLLGVLHGGAGSAAVLALLPLAHFKTGLESFVYLAFFSVGVAVGAVAFARVFALLAVRTAASGERIAAAFQATIGVLAIATGTWLFFEITHGGG